MKKTIFKMFAVTLVAAFTLSSCEMTKPISATSNPVGSKVGTAVTTGILAFPPFVGVGSAPSIQNAAKNGKITKISTVDYTYRFWILWSRQICTVTGE